MSTLILPPWSLLAAHVNGGRIAGLGLASLSPTQRLLSIGGLTARIFHRDDYTTESPLRDLR